MEEAVSQALSPSDHERFFKQDLDDLIAWAQDAREQYDPEQEVYQTLDNIIFTVGYLRHLRKDLYDAIFEGLKKKIPPLIIMAMICVAMGMSETDIDLQFSQPGVVKAIKIFDGA